METKQVGFDRDYYWSTDFHLIMLKLHTNPKKRQVHSVKFASCESNDCSWQILKFLCVMLKKKKKTGEWLIKSVLLNNINHKMVNYLKKNLKIATLYTCIIISNHISTHAISFSKTNKKKKCQC